MVGETAQVRFGRTTEHQSKAYPKDFILVPIKDMRHKASVCPEPLSRHHVRHALFLFCHIPNMVSCCIQYDVLVRLLETTV
jgi:hypothetical protein